MKNFFGELLGTFTLVFIGLFSVYGAVIEVWFNLYLVASLWVLAVFLGILVSRKLSPAHLNPAVTFGFIVSGEKISVKNVTLIILGQIVGAFIAAIAIYGLFQDGIVNFELANELKRGGIDSKKTAMIFGEFYPNPADKKEVSSMLAFVLEMAGTFVLMCSILICVAKLKSKNVIAFMIALTVGVLIVFIAPYTQAGFNPVRDFLPRLVSSILGWNNIVWSSDGFYPVLVYVLGPICGAVLAGAISRFVKKGLKSE